jgi:hypothetical protein
MISTIDPPIARWLWRPRESRSTTPGTAARSAQACRSAQRGDLRREHGRPVDDTHNNVIGSRRLTRPRHHQDQDDQHQHTDQRCLLPLDDLRPGGKHRATSDSSTSLRSRMTTPSSWCSSIWATSWASRGVSARPPRYSRNRLTCSRCSSASMPTIRMPWTRCRRLQSMCARGAFAASANFDAHLRRGNSLTAGTRLPGAAP